MQHAHKRVAALVLLGAVQTGYELPGVVETKGGGGSWKGLCQDMKLYSVMEEHTRSI